MAGPLGHILEQVGALLLAAGLGALIGFERERSEHPAGLRTHILVCVGAALYTLISRDMAGGRWDPARIAAQVVSGIGFLGAGTILRQGSVIRGLTTAASLWAVAGIGMAVAVGGEMTWLALVTALLVFLTLTVVNRLEIQSRGAGFRSLRVRVDADREAVGELLAGLVEQGVELRQVAIGPAGESPGYQVRLLLRSPPRRSASALAGWLARQRGLVSFEWE